MIDCGCDEILLPQGSDGVNGKNAYTVTTASFVQPAVGVAVTITVSDTLQSTNQWAIVGQIIRVTDSAGRGGWYQVTAITGTTQITATNLDYTGSTTAGLTIATGAGVSPAGIKGVDGAAGGQGLQGPVGSAPNISTGNVSQLNPGDQPTVQVNGTSPNYTIDFGIPQGFPGADGSGILHYSSTSTTAYTPASTAPGQTIFNATFATDTMCPNNGDAARITGSFFATGNFVSDPSRKIANLNFYIGDSAGSPVDIVPKASTTPSTDQSYRPRDLYLTDAGDYAHFGFEIRINRISSTESIITVSWEWSGLKGTFYKKMYVSNSLTTGSMTFNTGAQALFQVKIDPAYTTNSFSINNRNLMVEKITA
jgi:hypothetical protein